MPKLCHFVSQVLHTYLQFLQTELPHRVDDLTLVTRANMWFIYDGAAPLRTSVTSYANEMTVYAEVDWTWRTRSMAGTFALPKSDEGHWVRTLQESRALHRDGVSGCCLEMSERCNEIRKWPSTCIGMSMTISCALRRERHNDVSS
jgi:hypothetical protein